MIRGYRWVETGNRVWQLESQPRRFHGVVSCRFAYVHGRVMVDAGAPYSWWISGSQGEAKSKREAMDAVEVRTGR